MSQPRKLPPSPKSVYKFAEDDDVLRPYRQRRVAKTVEPAHFDNNLFIPVKAMLKDFALQTTLDNYVTRSSEAPRNSSRKRIDFEVASQPKAMECEIDGLLKDVDKEYGENILQTIIPTSELKMADILGNEDAKQALEESVILPTLNPALFSGLREPCKGILLFGPPGNGKTMLAKAVATESECTFFNISAATIMSKWVGDGEKMMQALFKVARNAQPSIIFIDEVDSLLSERKENENGASRRVKTEFLLQFDGCSTKSGDRILVLGATNRPQELDDAILRRFPRRIYIDLPSEEARANLIKLNFQKTGTHMEVTNEELTSIAQICDNYSFSDLTALCREAAMLPLKGISREQLHHITNDQLRPVNYQDLLDATKLVRASSNPENVKRLKEFANCFA